RDRAHGEQARVMTLRDLVQALGRAVPERPAGAAGRDVPIAGVTHDSRAVRPGVVFVALRGLKVDGSTFAPQAMAAGASAIVAETSPATPVPVPWIAVPDARAALALMAAAFHRHPSREM